MDIVHGQVLLQKYRVERVLGQGGMGVVLAARHLALGELVAIKLLRAGGADNGEAYERFLREARAAARLRSENVCRVHDFGRLADGQPYMVMDYLEGIDLADVVARRGPLPVVEAAEYVAEACSALTEAHALGIIHRDLKPSNLFLTPRVEGGVRVKVLDFGISKINDPASSALTATGAMLGTPLYMSPEQLVQTSSVDRRADIWSMGVVLYELVTGTWPFFDEALPIIIAKTLNAEPAPPSSLRNNLPLALERIILRCLRKNPGDRPESAQALAGELRAFIQAQGALPFAETAVAAALAQGPAPPPVPDLPSGVPLTEPADAISGKTTSDIAVTMPRGTPVGSPASNAESRSGRSAAVVGLITLGILTAAGIGVAAAFLTKEPQRPGADPQSAGATVQVTPSSSTSPVPPASAGPDVLPPSQHSTHSSLPQPPPPPSAPLAPARPSTTGGAKATGEAASSGATAPATARTSATSAPPKSTSTSRPGIY